MAKNCGLGQFILLGAGSDWPSEGYTESAANTLSRLSVYTDKIPFNVPCFYDYNACPPGYQAAYNNQLCCSQSGGNESCRGKGARICGVGRGVTYAKALNPLQTELTEVARFNPVRPLASQPVNGLGNWISPQRWSR